jgi:hypothetical protein
MIISFNQHMLRLTPAGDIRIARASLQFVPVQLQVLRNDMNTDQVKEVVTARWL